MRIPGRIFWIVALLTLGGLAQSVFSQEISSVSPFLPRNGTAGAATQNSPIELRGIMPIAGGMLFGLFDPVQKKHGWVKLNEAGQDFLVRTYDAANEVATVEYQGRVLNLPLAQPKIEKLPAMAMAAPPRPMPGPQGPQVAPTPSVDDAKRIEAVAAEVARRRQARQAAAQQQPQTPPPQQPQPVRQRP